MPSAVLGHLIAVVAVTIAHPQVCSDFRLTSAFAHSRTGRPAPLSARAAQGARALQVAGWPVWHRAHADAGGPNMKVDRLCMRYNSVQLSMCLRSRHLENGNFLRTISIVSEMLLARQTAAVSRCVSELHGKKYRILEIYVFAAWKPVLTCRGGLQGQR